MKARNIMIALLLCSCLVHAQDFKERIKAIRNDYEQSKSLQIVMGISVYENGQSGQPNFEQMVDIKRQDNNYLYQVGDNEMLLNEKYLVMVDKNSRQISCTNRDPEAERELQKAFQFNLDSILGQYDNFRYIGIEDSTEHFVVSEKNGPIEQIHFFTAQGNNTLRKIAYQYREGQYVSIDFMVFDKNILFEADTFSEGQYFSLVNKKLMPTEFFKGYSINDQ